MTKSRASLTELEGAILGVLRRDPNCTAYRIRQVFLSSRSAEWSGSAGAVYPALKRLRVDGILSDRVVKDKRGTQIYRLTPLGRNVHDRWLCDQNRAIGSGLDPFRTRAGLWSLLPPLKWAKLLHRLKRAIELRRKELVVESTLLDQGDMNMTSLHLAVQDVRLNWIELRLKELPSK